MTRSLNVWCNLEQVGTLSEENDIWTFEYSSDWSGFELSPDLPSGKKIIDGSSYRSVQWFFDNLLPEEGARTLLASDAGIEVADNFSLLEHFGAESAGAFTLLAPDETQVEGGEKELPFEDLSARIQNLPDSPLSTGSSKRMSLAGAQHKLPLIYRDGRLYEAISATPSTHILKPEHSDPTAFHNTVVNEWFVMRLAAKCGLNVPQVDRLSVPEPVYLIERFDRKIIGNTLNRLHTIDALQLLGISRAFKYTQCSLENLSRLIERCRESAKTRTQIFNWLVFNFLVGNDDDHLKNLSFFAVTDGYQLTPHYDLLCTVLYKNPEGTHWNDRKPVWPITETNKRGKVTHKDLIAIGVGLGMKEAGAKTLLKQLCAKLTASIDAIYQQAHDKMKSDKIDGPRMEGELRLLRQIKAVSKEAVAQVIA